MPNIAVYVFGWGDVKITIKQKCKNSVIERVQTVAQLYCHRN